MKIDWSEPTFTESSLQGYYLSPWSFEETVARLITASGKPAESDDQHKTLVCFEGSFDGQRFTLYDYKEDRRLHIGGSAELDWRELSEELTKELKKVEPTPYTAKEFYDQKGEHSWSS